jgi:hypothetical protein
MSKLNKIGLIALLIVFPIVSWIYLKSGFNFQKEQMEDLQMRKPVDLIMNVDINPDLLLNNVVLLMTNGESSKGDGDLILSLLKQFSVHPNFKLLYLNSLGKLETQIPANSKIEKDKLIIIDSPDNDKLIEDLGLGSFCTHSCEGLIFLIDEKEDLRRTYVSSDLDQLKELASNVSILLPREKRKTFETKTN